MLYHVYEHLEHSWCQRHRRSIQSPQQSFGCVELEVAKFVDVSRGRLHRGFRIILEKIQRELMFHKGTRHFPLRASSVQTSPAQKETKTHKNSKSKITVKKKKMKKHLKNNPLKPTNRKSSFLLIPMVFLCLALSPLAQAVVPAPDGGYPGGNTAEGQNALFNITNGTYNTGVGVFSLRSDTEGNFNTAVGAGLSCSMSEIKCGRGHRKHRHWRRRAFEQHDWRIQLGPWSLCPF